MFFFVFRGSFFLLNAAPGKTLRRRLLKNVNPTPGETKIIKFRFALFPLTPQPKKVLFPAPFEPPIPDAHQRPDGGIDTKLLPKHVPRHPCVKRHVDDEGRETREAGCYSQPHEPTEKKRFYIIQHHECLGYYQYCRQYIRAILQRSTLLRISLLPNQGALMTNILYQHPPFALLFLQGLLKA